MNKLKVIIAENSPIMLQELAESISKDIDLELVGVADNGKDALNLIEVENPDVVLFDLLLSYYDGFALMDKYNQSEYKDENIKFIMTTPLANDVIISESGRRGIHYLMVKPYNIEMISEKIKDVCHNAEIRQDMDNYSQSIDWVISKNLNRIGVPASLKGYRYMKTAIKEVLDDETVLDGVTKILYPVVAKKHNSTPQRVEKAIRHAIEVAWARNDIDSLNENFEFSVNVGKLRPTNSEFIAVVSQKIKMNA